MWITYLVPFELFGVEVIGLRHEEMADNVFFGLILEHVGIEVDIVIVLIILFVFEMVYYCQLWWCELQQHLYWH